MRFAILLLSLLFLGAFILSIAWGPYPLFTRLVQGDPGAHFILFSLRLPRTLLALGVGMALSVAGLGLQTLLANPLAEPYFLGISSGSALGTALGLALGFTLHHPLLYGLSFGFAFVTTFIVYKLSIVKGVLRMERLLLAGILLNGFFSSLLLFFLHRLPPSHLASYFQWMMGNIDALDGVSLSILFLVLVLGCFFFFWFHRSLDCLAIGEEWAHSMGVSVEMVKRLLFMVSALLTAVTVTLAGIIGFVGLIVPNVCRMITSTRHLPLLMATLLMGGTLVMLACDVSRLFPSLQLPVGALTTLLGVPFFFYLLRKV